MAPEGGPASAGEHRLALRDGADRRKAERRARSRGGANRRWSQRRGQLLGHALLASLTIGVPAPMKTTKARPAPLSSSSPREIEEAGVSPVADSVPAPPRAPYEDLIIEAAQMYHLDPRLIRSVVQVESAFNAMAVSPVGAQGLMQLRPSLARELGVHNPFDPRESIMGGARLLRRLIDRHEGDIRLALGSYNAGPRNVARYGGVPPFPETKNYIKRIIDLLEQGPET